MSSPSGGADSGNSGAYAEIIKAAAQSAGNAMQNSAQNQGSRAETREAKRRTLANLFNHTQRRRNMLFQSGQEHQDEMNDYQSQALQQIARGFIESLQGSTSRS